MDLRDVMETFARRRANQVVMVSPGRSGTTLESVGHREPTLYNQSMAYAAPLCFGLALARPDLRVVAIEGDGSLIAGLGHLTTLARYPLHNLTVLVIDNGRYLSTDRGELATATAARADLRAIARSAGIERAATTESTEELDGLLGRAFSEDGPWIVVAKVEPTKARAPTERAYEGPDRTEASMLFRRWLLEHPPANELSGRASLSGRPRMGLIDDQTPNRVNGRTIYAALKEAGVDLFVYLPDTVTYPVQELAEADLEMETICCAREDEGIAIACGAWYGGRTAAVVMEGTGVGYSGLVLGLAIVRRTPLLIVSSHAEQLGVRAEHNTTPRIVNEPILRELHLPYTVLTDVRDAPRVFRESVHSMRVLKLPVGVIVPPYVMFQVGAA